MVQCIRAPNPIWFFFDLVGLPLNDEYYLHILTNDLPYLPQFIFMDPECTQPWSDPIQFGPNAGLPDNMYWDPSATYRLEVRHGPTQFDQLIYEINNFQPGSGIGPNPNSLRIFDEENEISNSQFSQVTFIIPPAGTFPQITFTTAGTYPIAPGWDLILTGIGTCVVTQLAFSGTDWQQIPPDDPSGNPPYALEINANGFGSVQLRQRFDHYTNIWSLGAVAMSISARSGSLSALPITLVYAPSDGGAPTTIASGNVGTGNFETLAGATNLNNPGANPPTDPGIASTNTDFSTTGYVDIIIQLPPTGIIQVTNVQIQGQTLPLPLNFNQSTDIPDYAQEPIERQIDHLFHYYKEPLSFKPIPSYLVGWDFPVNPAQVGTAFGPTPGANASFYCWDQTIYFQSVTSGIAVSRVTPGGLGLSASADTQAAIIQYLPQVQARKLLENIISLNMDAFSASGAGSGSIGVTISLWATTDAALPSTVGANQSIVATLDANGKPATFNGNWTEIEPLNGENAFTLVTGHRNYNFSGYWNNNGNALSNTATFFAIVIGTQTITTADSIVFQSIGLQSGRIGTIPAPQTSDEVLRECQHYYEQSYVPGVAPGSATSLGRITNLQNWNVTGGNIAIRPGIFRLDFKAVKNTAPNLVFYAPSNGASDNVDVNLWNGGTVIAFTAISFSANWVLADAPSIYGANYSPASFTPLVNPAAVETAPQSTMIYHYTADSRLGL